MSKLNLIFIILAAINLGIACYTLNFSAICGWFAAVCTGIQLHILEN